MSEKSKLNLNKILAEYWLVILIAVAIGAIYIQSQQAPKQVNVEAQTEAAPVDEKAKLEAEKLELEMQKTEVEKQLKIKAKEAEILELKNQ